MSSTARSAAGSLATAPCTREDHEQMKRDERTFRRGTRFLGVQGASKRGTELRNCTRCGSTLTAPAKKARKLHAAR